MLTEICEFLRNWFDLDRIFGNFRVENGSLIWEDNPDIGLQDGQYYRIIGSVFNDGVHIWGSEGDSLKDENSFNGSVWAMGVPPAVIAISQEVETYMQNYGGVDSAAMSPYTSESFAGYSYSKNEQGRSSSSSEMTPLWYSAFGPRLMRWKKL